MNMPSLTAADLAQLGREIAARITDDSLLDVQDVASLLKVSARYVSENYAQLPNFPKAIRLANATGNLGQPRYRRGDVIAWINAHNSGRRPGRSGRPRETPAIPS